jgi:cellulose synthase operon protein C
MTNAPIPYRWRGGRRRGARWVAAFVLAMSVAACSEKSADDYVVSAKRYIAKKDHKAASIELRNAVQRSPKHAEARYLLGTVILEQGAAGAAEVELRQAIALGRDGNDVQAALANALFRAGQFGRLIKEFESKTFADPELDSTLRLHLGNAYLARGARKEAAEAFDSVLRALPEHVGARIGLARLKAAEKDFAGANRLAESILAKSPDLPEALFLKAELQGAQADINGALATLEELVRIDPRHIAGHLARVHVHVTRGEIDHAGTAIQELLKIAPADPRVLYLQGLIAFRQGKPAEARDAITKVLTTSPDHVPSMLLSGLIAHQLRDYPTAETNLRKVVSQTPAASMPRQALAAVLLESGQPERALETLRPLLDAKNAKAFAIAGEAYLAMGESAKALEALQKSATLDPKSARVMMKLGEARLALGEMDRAIDHLEAASSADPSTYRADLLLVANYLKRNELARALKAAATLEEKQPKNPLTHSLIADIHLAAGKWSDARQRLNSALELKPDYVPALAALANLDLKEGRIDAARERYEDVAKRFPASEGAWLGLASVHVASGMRPARIVPTLEKAVAAIPSSARIHVALIQTHLRAGNTRGAVAAARQADVRFKDEPAVTEMLGQAEKAAGELEIAAATFARVVTMRPNEVAPLIRLAEVQLALKDTSRALTTAEKALAQAPGSIEAHRARALILVELGRRADAFAASRALQKHVPTHPAGHILEGEVAFRFKDFATGESALRKAVAQKRSTETIGALHSALESVGKRDEAAALADRWMAENPKDVTFRLAIGQRALAERNYKRAIEAYQSIVALQPQNAVAWNNLAWAAMQTRDGRAQEFAEKALTIAPNNPQIKDTLGTILAEKGEAKRALQLLREATSEAPDLFEIRLNLAKALLKAGEKDAARKELDVLIKQNTHVPSRDEAKELLGRI